MTTFFALVDCNNFYASCERLFQPALRDKPVVVLSNNDGCVIARSNEAKALGVEMGTPWHLARERFEKLGIVVRSSNYVLYGDMSARVMKLLAGFAPAIEVYSIDEAFLDLTGFDGRRDEIGRRLRAHVLQWTGIPVSIGIAPSKTLAKLANRLAKKDPASGGVLSLDDAAAQEAALARVSLTDLWGVARGTQARLAELGITTALALRHADHRFIREKLGVVGERIVLELQGTPCVALKEVAQDRKNIVSSRSFGTAITLLEDMREAVVDYTTKAAVKMRRQHLATAHLAVFVETNRFRPDQRQHYAIRPYHLPVATSDTGRLVTAALRVLETIWRDGHRYHKAGVMLMDLGPAEKVTGGLFDRPDPPQSIARMRAMDDLNKRFGRGTVAMAGAGIRRGWGMRAEYLSKRYTTRWEEVLEV